MICAIGYRACGGPTNSIRPARESGKVIQCGRERPRSCCAKERPLMHFWELPRSTWRQPPLGCPVEQRSTDLANTRNSEALLRRTAGAAVPTWLVMATRTSEGARAYISDHRIA